MKNKYLVKLWDASSVYEMDALDMEMDSESVIGYIDSEFECDGEYFNTVFRWSINYVDFSIPIDGEDIFIEVELEMDDEIRELTNKSWRGEYEDDWDIIEHIEWNMMTVSKIVCKYDCENNELYKYI
ncbi:MAG: hypothetical protein J6Y78_11415 [Paludibacteraceae bacterium]|nr:hypothetical protein [Paludibacteraceae bacterium]